MGVFIVHGCNNYPLVLVRFTAPWGKPSRFQALYTVQYITLRNKFRIYLFPEYYAIASGKTVTSCSIVMVVLHALSIVLLVLHA